MDESFLVLGLITLFSLVTLFFFGVNAMKSSQRKQSVSSNTWIPGNRLEEKLQLFEKKDVSLKSVISILVASELFILTTVEGKTDPRECEFCPGARGSKLISVYSSLSQIKIRLRSTEGKWRRVEAIFARNWIPCFPNGYGLVVNPDHESSLEVLPEDFMQLKFEQG